MKTCSKCVQEKDESVFSWNIRGVKKHSACNPCRALEQADYYQKTKPKQLKYKAERQVQKREEARRFVFNYLKSHPCVDCGESAPLVLTFDHVRGRQKMNISQMVNQGYSLEALQDEIGKCEVRCGNCHMRIENRDEAPYTINAWTSSSFTCMYT